MASWAKRQQKRQHVSVIGEVDVFVKMCKRTIILFFLSCENWHSRFCLLPLVLSELDDTPTPRTDAILRLFRSSGLPARLRKNVDAYLKTHAAGLPAIAGAVYMAGGDIRRLAHMPEVVRLFVRSYREALRGLRAAGIPVKPYGTHLVEWIPEQILMFGLRFFFDTKLAVQGGQRHINAAPDEMKEFADEFREIFRQTGLSSPASDILFAQIDSRFAVWEEKVPQGSA